MNVIVTKQPDGEAYLTEGGFGTVLDAELEPNGEGIAQGDLTVNVLDDWANPFAEDGDLVVEFSWVDYLDTANRAVPSDGVRHTVVARAPGNLGTGPYAVVVSE